MAEAQDIELLLYTRLREILEGDPQWSIAFDVGNRIWYNVQQPSAPEKPTSADGDYPSSKLRCRSGQSGFYSTDETFDTYGNPMRNPHAVEKGTYVFRLALTSQLLGQSEQSELRKLSENAIRKAGPRIGLPYVTRVTYRFDTEDIELPGEDPTHRERTEMDITIEYEADVVFLKGDAP